MTFEPKERATLAALVGAAEGDVGLILEQVLAIELRHRQRPGAGEKGRVLILRQLVSELQKDAKEGAGDEQAVLRREKKRRIEAAGGLLGLPVAWHGSGGASDGNKFAAAGLPGWICSTF